MNWFDTLLWPLMVAVAWLMVQFHKFFTLLGLGSGSGVTWALSIVGLVIVIRILLIPLFFRQIKASRGMQVLSPELQALQKKYKGRNDPASREAMSRETMELYRKHGTNPFASCLPALAQSPVFFALFRVLNELRHLADGVYQRPNIGPLTQELAIEANAATIFDAPISSSFLMEGATAQTKVVTVILIVLMSVTVFTTQKQLTQKNMPASALQGPMAQQQKMLLYILPLVFAISGVNFPIGVLIYWTTTNLWTMGQQFYVIRRNPTPGSEAERRLKERRARKAAKRGIVLEEEPETPAEPEKPKGQRQQPVRKDRARTRPPTGSQSAPAAGQGGKATRSGAGGTRTGAAGQTASKAGSGKPGAGKPGAGKPGAARPGGGKAGSAKGGSGTPSSGSGNTAASRKPSTGTSMPSGKAGPARPAGAEGRPPQGKKRRRPPGAGAPGSAGTGPAKQRPEAQRPDSSDATQTTPDAETQDER